MAGINDVNLYGFIMPIENVHREKLKKNPQIKKDLSEMRLVLSVYRRTYANNDTTGPYAKGNHDEVLIITRNESFIRSFIDFPAPGTEGRPKIKLKAFDIVLVSGSFHTEPAAKYYRCKNPECPSNRKDSQYYGSFIPREGILASVNPTQITVEGHVDLSESDLAAIEEDVKTKIFAEDLKKGDPDYEERVAKIRRDAAARILSNNAWHKCEQHSEFSKVTLNGYINTKEKDDGSSEPAFYRKVVNNRQMTQMVAPLFVPRRRTIPEDGPEVRADFPWIVAYGDVAVQCDGVLHRGSEISLKGAVQVRKHDTKMQCPYCNKLSETSVYDTEIVAYNVEFSRNCDVPEGEEGDGFIC